MIRLGQAHNVALWCIQSEQRRSDEAQQHNPCFSYAPEEPRIWPRYIRTTIPLDNHAEGNTDKEAFMALVCAAVALNVSALPPRAIPLPEDAKKPTRARQ